MKQQKSFAVSTEVSWVQLDVIQEPGNHMLYQRELCRMANGGCEYWCESSCSSS